MTNILCIREGTIFDEVTGRSIEFTIGVCRKNTTPLSFLRQRCGVRSLKKERGLTAHGRIPAARIQAQPSRLEVIVSDTPAPMMSETDERTPPIIYFSKSHPSSDIPRFAQLCPENCSVWYGFFEIGTRLKNKMSDTGNAKNPVIAMVSWHAEITSSKIVSTTSGVDLIFFTKSWENLGNTPKKGNSDAVHIFSSQFSRTERRGTKRNQTPRSVLNHLRRIRLLPSQGNFHLLQFHIPFLLHFRILCEPADCTLLQFHIRRGAGNTQEVFVRIRRVQTMEALSQFPVCISGQMCQFWHLTRPSPMGHTKPLERIRLAERGG